MSSSARWRRHAAVALVVAGGLLAGCASSPTAAPPAAVSPVSPAPTASASPTPDPVEQAKAEVLAVYRAFWAAQAKSMEDPQRRPDAGLAKNARGQALNDAKVTLIATRRDGLQMRGRPVLSPRASIDGGIARVRDCLDASNWYAVSAKTGKRVSSTMVGPRLAFEVEATATTVDGQWKMDAVTLRRERSC